MVLHTPTPLRFHVNPIPSHAVPPASCEGIADGEEQPPLPCRSKLAEYIPSLWRVWQVSRSYCAAVGKAGPWMLRTLHTCEDFEDAAMRM